MVPLDVLYLYGVHQSRGNRTQGLVWAHVMYPWFGLFDTSTLVGPNRSTRRLDTYSVIYRRQRTVSQNTTKYYVVITSLSTY